MLGTPCQPLPIKRTPTTTLSAGTPAATGFDVAQALPVGQLGERHGPIVLGAGQRPHPLIAIVPRHNPRERAPRQKIHQLGEKRLATVHRRLLGNPPKSARSSSNRHHAESSKLRSES